MSDPVRLGAFELREPIGRGSTGVVWQGVHHDTGVTVAIKVLDRSGPAPNVPDPFRNEVRAMANLDHPAIVRVYDVGRVGARAASRGRDLEVGSPYVVMEYASGGTLGAWLPDRWDEVHPVLVSLLGALAHAHAHQLIHRDLKPGNVLLAGSDATRPGWKLTDFGIATAMERTVERSIAQELVGTLAYMSPEQIEGNWREYGPWTDLYALGCLMYRLVGTDKPFPTARGAGLITAHMLEAPQRLRPRMAAPSDLDAWVARLLEKDPRDRFQSAAEALRVLEGLGPANERVLAPAPPPDDATAEIEGPTDVVRGGSSRTGGRVARSWRTDRDEAPGPPAAREVSAGLPLVSLRDPPFVGREAERDLLWERLHAVLARGRAEVVLIRGQPGLGRSRLARWIGELAHERLGLPFLVGDARQGESPLQALGRPFRRWLRTVRLGHDERLARIARAVGADRPELAADVEEMLEASDPPRLGPEARYAAARQLVERLALRARGAVLLYDDAHLSGDLFGFARHLAQAQAIRPTPVLLVLAVGHPEPAFEARGALGEALREIDLAPLRPDEHRRLVHAIAPLEPVLAEQLAERTEGNPLQPPCRWCGAGRRPGTWSLAVGAGARRARRRRADAVSRRAQARARGPAGGARVARKAPRRRHPCPTRTGRSSATTWPARAQRGQRRFVPEHAIRYALRAAGRGGLAAHTDDGWRFLQALFRETVPAGHRPGAREPPPRRGACAAAPAPQPPPGGAIGATRWLERAEQAILGTLLEAWRQRASGRRLLRRRCWASSSPRCASPGCPRPTSAGPRWRCAAPRCWRLGLGAEAHRAAADAERRARPAAGRRCARAARVAGEVLLTRGDLRAADAVLARAEAFVAEGEDPRPLGRVHASRSRCAHGLGEGLALGHAVLSGEVPGRRRRASAWPRPGRARDRAWPADGELPEASGRYERARSSRRGSALRSARRAAGRWRRPPRLGRPRRRPGGARRRWPTSTARPALLDVVLALLEQAVVERHGATGSRPTAWRAWPRGDADPANQPGRGRARRRRSRRCPRGCATKVSAERHVQRAAAHADRRDPDVAWCLELAAARAEAADRRALAAEARRVAVRTAPERVTRETGS
ncbi:MAG: protein kinase [Myxococcota bacterium]